MISLLNFFATIITIANFFYAAISFFGGNGYGVPEIPFDAFFIRLILLVIFEAILGTAFGLLIVLLYQLQNAFMLIMAIVVASFSAWLSVFNCEWLLTQSLPKDIFWALKLFGLGAVCMVIATIFISEHSDRNYVSADGIITIQWLAYVVTFIIFIIGIWTA